MGPSIYVTRRFQDAYDRGLRLRHMAEGTVQDFVRRYRSNAVTCILNYDRVEGLNQTVLEFKIAGGPRMLGLWQPPRLTLLDLGNHEITGRLRRTDVRHAKENAVEAPPQFYPETRGFFLATPDLDWTDYRDRERLEEWAFFLDEQQATIANTIYEASIETLLEDGRPQVHLVMGGPGTGKTCILLNLLQRLTDEKFDVCLEVSDQVARYLREAALWDLKSLRGSAERRDEVAVVLADDPATHNDITSLARTPKRGLAKIVVLAVDPLQLDRAPTDEAFDELMKRHRVHLHQLSVCYRQKAKVGEVTKKAAEIIARSTPFLAKEKQQVFWNERERLTSLCNDLLEFPNPHGYRLAHPDASVEDFRRELNRIKSHEAGQWGYWPPLLVAIIDDDVGQLPKAWSVELRNSGVQHQVLGPLELGQAKGVEYQHVFLVMGRALFDQLDAGFEGTGQSLYERRRLLRIPYSRAKDSLALFALPERK
jgi:hypothetical protein